MLKYDFTITNLVNGKSFTTGQNLSGQSATIARSGYLLQVYPGFTLEVRNEEQVKSGQHGIFDFYSFYGKRNINFQGIIIGQSHADIISYQRRIQEVLALPAQPGPANDGYIKISWTDDNGDSWYVMAKITNDPQFSRNLKEELVMSFLISLKATSHLILSTQENLVSGLMGWRQGQMIVPGYVPNNINIILDNELDIYKAGNADSPVKVRLYGAADNPKITKLTEVPADETILATFEPTEGWAGGTEDTTHFLFGGASRKLTSNNAGQDVMTLDGSFNLDFDPAYGIALPLSSLDSLSGWSTTGDATDLILDSVVKKEGSFSFNFKVTVAASGQNYAGIRRTDLPVVDASVYNSVYADFWAFIPSVLHLSGIYLDLSGDGGLNGGTFLATTNSVGGALGVGWNQIKVPFSSLVQYGTGLNASTINCVEMRLVYTGAQTDMINCRFDSLVLHGNIKREFVTFYFYIDDVSQMEFGGFATAKNYVKFKTTIGVDEFAIEFQAGNNTLRNGWNYFRILKDQFEVIGTPIWSNIVQIEFSVKSIVGGNVNISFDDLRVKNVTFTEQFLSLAYSLLDGEYADFSVEDGTILKNDGTDLLPYLSLDSNWFYLISGNNTLLYESDNNPLVTWVYPTQPIEVRWRDALI